MKRYDRELSLEIDRTVQRFNNKIKRLQKEERNLELPEPITRSDIFTSRATKSTIEKKLKEYQKFLERGAEETITTTGGVKLSKYEFNQLKSRQKSAKASLTKQINKYRNMNPRVAGIRQAGTFESMGDPYYYGLVGQRKALNKDFEQVNTDTFKRLKGLTNKLTFKRDKDLVFKENYLEMIEKNGYRFGIDKRKVDILKKKLNSLSPRQFVELYNSDKAIQAMFDQYVQANDIKNEEDFRYLSNQAEDLFDELVNNIDEVIEGYD